MNRILGKHSQLIVSYSVKVIFYATKENHIRPYAYMFRAACGANTFWNNLIRITTNGANIEVLTGGGFDRANEGRLTKASAKE